jgi:hypothetical protein
MVHKTRIFLQLALLATIGSAVPVKPKMFPPLLVGILSGLKRQSKRNGLEILLNLTLRI